MTKCIAWGRKAVAKIQGALCAWTARCRCKLMNAQGQGTTEYAILVGVLVVIAIAAIVVFRPSIEKLWEAIIKGFEDLK